MRNVVLLILMGLACPLFSQVTVEGYTFESNNRGYLNLVRIQIFDQANGQEVAEVFSDLEGKFMVDLPMGVDYKMVSSKDLFHPVEQTFSTKGKAIGDKMFLKVSFERKPGYIFDVTLAEKREEGMDEVSAIQDVKIEIYNNTKDREELVLDNHPKHVFNYTFEDGNHYTVLIRKDGYFAKRLEAYVNIDGCIMCFDGIDELEQTAPAVSDNLTARNTMGTLVANVEMESLRMNKKLIIQNIYYNYNSAELRKDALPGLDKIIFLLKNNPQIDVELGAHTDSRGSDAYNLKLSKERAASAVKYILENSNIKPNRIYAKGYGESKILNKCKNGVTCNEWDHKKNRRTEIRVTGIRSIEEDPWAKLSLREIIRREKSLESFDEMNFEDQLVLKPGQTLEEALAEQKALREGASEMTKQEETSAIPDGYFSNSSSTTVTSRPTATPSTTVANKVQKAAAPAAKATKVVEETVKAPVKTVKKEVAKAPVTAQVVEKPSPQATTPKPSTTSTGTVASEGYKVPQSGFMARPPRAIGMSYSGYKIEFFTSKDPLPLSHLVFQKHGNIHLDILKDRTHSYLLGDFPTSQSAKNFLDEVMLPQYPKARIIEYQQGGRIRAIN